MASIPCVLIVLLICWTQDHMGVRGESPHVFSSVGQNATLSCGNVNKSDCSGTTWIYSGGGTAVEVVMLGKVKECTDPPNSDECKRAKRLSLHSGCSLHITEVTTDDAGPYACQQYEGKDKPKIGDNDPVHLSVLYVSMSPKVTEPQAGRNVTLHCVLHTRDQHCGGSVKNKGVRLSWVDMRGTELENRTYHQIRTTSLCNITLTEKLRDPYPNRKHWKWRCQLTAGQVNVFANYTIKNKDFKSTSSSTSVSKSSTPKTTTSTTSNSDSSDMKPTSSSTSVSTPKATTSNSDSSDVPLIAVGVGVPLVLLAAALIIVVMHKRRTNAGGEANHRADQSRTSATPIQSVPPPTSSPNQEEEADLHYAAFQQLNPTQAGPSAKQSEDTVTYSSIMQLSGGEEQNSSRPAGGPADPSAVYATVQKSDKTQR